MMAGYLAVLSVADSGERTREGVELGSKFGELLFEPFHTGAEVIAGWVRARGRRRRGRRMRMADGEVGGVRRWIDGVQLRAEQLRVPHGAGAGRRSDFSHQRAGPAGAFGFNGASRQAVENVLHDLDGFQMMHAAGIAAKLPEGLGASQKQLGKDDELAGGDIQDFTGNVAEFLDSRPGQADFAHKLLGLEAIEASKGAVFIDRGDRVSIVLLIASDYDGVQGKRILGRGGLCLLDQHTKNAALIGGQMTGHGGSVPAAGKGSARAGDERDFEDRREAKITLNSRDSCSNVDAEKSAPRDRLGAMDDESSHTGRPRVERRPP
jgi:hypothetical protein